MRWPIDSIGITVQALLAARTFGKFGLRSQGLLAIFAAMSNPAVRLVEGMGGRAAVATQFGVSPEAVRLWLINGIPADRALEAEEKTSGTEFAITAIEVLQYIKSQREQAAA